MKPPRIFRYALAFFWLFPLAFSGRAAAASKEALIIDQQKDDMNCQDFKTRFWDTLDRYLVKENKIPEAAALFSEIHELENKKLWSPAIAGAFADIYKTLFEFAPTQETLDSAQKFRMLFAALEVGDESTGGRKTLKDKISPGFAVLIQHGAGAHCPQIFPARPADEFERQASASSVPRALLGMRWAFATAYQNCHVLEKKPLTLADPDVQGIVNLGSHEDNVGRRRIIGDLPKLLRTHYYYKNESPQNQCRDFRTAPLIYDYGGKPFSSDQGATSLDIFTDDGTGTPTLGLDCSAAVFTAIATAGLKLAPEAPLRARNTLGVNSRMYMSPQNNGLSCFTPIAISARDSLRAGDIAAINGHVLMIGETGADPFGIKRVHSASGCHRLPKEYFDFDIWQSSPEKNGIGLNRYRAADYMSESFYMRQGFESYATQACLASFQKRSRVPKVRGFTIIRHKGTPECLDQRVPLTGESCIENCQPIFKDLGVHE